MMGAPGMMPMEEPAAAAAAVEEKKEEKEEQKEFDVKIEEFDKVAKIKIIKEMRGFTELGLKEAKELVI